jgi:hypothetical protein
MMFLDVRFFNTWMAFSLEKKIAGKIPAKTPTTIANKMNKAMRRGERYSVSNAWSEYSRLIKWDRKSRNIRKENMRASKAIITDSTMNWVITCALKAPMVFRIPISRERLKERAIDKFV